MLVAGDVEQDGALSGTTTASEAARQVEDKEDGDDNDDVRVAEDDEFSPKDVHWTNNCTSIIVIIIVPLYTVCLKRK